MSRFKKKKKEKGGKAPLGINYFLKYFTVLDHILSVIGWVTRFVVAR